MSAIARSSKVSEGYTLMKWNLEQFGGGWKPFVDNAHLSVPVLARGAPAELTFAPANL